MHWLPLVAMVIASALPFPHSPVSRVAVATAEPSSLPLREHRYEQPASLVALPVKHRAPGNILGVVINTDAALQENVGHERGSVGGQTSSPGTQPSQTDSDVLSQGSMLRTEELSKASSQPKDRSDPTSRPQHLDLVGFSDPQDKQRTTVSSEFPDHSMPPGTGPPFPPSLEDENLNQEAGLGLDGIFVPDEMFLDAHPRVLFSASPSPPEHPPLLLMLESELLEEEQENEDRRFEGHGDRAPDRGASLVTAEAPRSIGRDKRSLERRRGELSVCESESNWMNKSTAVDVSGNNVSVMMEIQTQKGPLKQFFYETRCRRAELRSFDGRSKSPGAAARPDVSRRGCLGVDKKQWESECKVKQSYVRALTKDERNKVSWKWIRIDSSCVCVLFRANQKGGRAMTGRG